MDRPIAKGDLVMAVKWPCCGHAIGYVFIAQSGPCPGTVRERPYRTRCRNCGHVYMNMPVVISDADKRRQAPAEFLIRIDPPALPESVETTEQVPA